MKEKEHHESFSFLLLACSRFGAMYWLFSYK
jgi:hypothetical protein